MAQRQEIFEVITPHRIDSGATPPPSAPIVKGSTAEGYREIGKILLDAEQTYISVGIPLLLSCMQFDVSPDKKLPLDDFLQQSLVNINTPTLLHYAKDLDAAQNDISAEALHIGLADYQRCFFPLISMFISALVLSAFLLVCGLSEQMATLLALFFASAIGYITCETARDSYRRSSFQKTLEIEIQRRHGRANTNTAAIKLNPLCE